MNNQHGGLTDNKAAITSQAGSTFLAFLGRQAELKTCQRVACVSQIILAFHTQLRACLC